MTSQRQILLSIIVLVATAMSVVVLATGGAILPSFLTQSFTQLASPVELTPTSFFDDYDTSDFINTRSLSGVVWDSRNGALVFTEKSSLAGIGKMESKRFYTGPVGELSVNLTGNSTSAVAVEVSSDIGVTWCSAPYQSCLGGETFQYRLTFNAPATINQIMILWRLPSPNIDLKQKFDTYYARQYPNGLARTLSSSYFSEPYLAGLISMYEATQNTKYLENTLDGVEHLISLLRDIDGNGGDSYLEWAEGNGTTGIALEDHDNNPATPRRYSCLDAERGVRQFARLVRIIKNDSQLNVTYGTRADAVIRIIEHDIIQHPYCRDRYTATFTNGDAPVYHIISHGALILNELYLATGNQTYRDIATAKAQLLKDKLFQQPTDPKALVWGTTACRELKYTYPDCYYVKTTNRVAHPVCKDSSQGWPYCSPADTSHAENFVFAAIELYRSGVVFTRADINALAYTFLAKVWDGNATDPRYRDFIDGNLEPADAINEGGYGQWWMGSNTAPGWVGLGAFNLEVSKVALAGDSSSVTNKANQIAYYGELARNLVAKDCQYTNRAREIADGIDNDCDGIVDEGVTNVTTTLTAFNPPTGAVDARNTSKPSFKDVSLTFSGSITGITASDFSVSSSNATAPTVASVSTVSSTNLNLSLSRSLLAGERVSITYSPSGSKVCLGFLPGDVNGDGTTAPADQLDMIDALNHTKTLPIYSTDIDRNGGFASADILALVDILNDSNANGKKLLACNAIVATVSIPDILPPPPTSPPPPPIPPSPPISGGNNGGNLPIGGNGSVAVATSSATSSLTVTPPAPVVGPLSPAQKKSLLIQLYQQLIKLLQQLLEILRQH